MEKTKDLTLPVERISPGDGHYFFGYYDVPAYSGDEQYHLCHKVDFMDRMPEPDDVAVLGVIRLADSSFTPLAETTAWNFQQGAMLQWGVSAPNEEVVFNRREGARYVGVVRNVRTGMECALSHAAAAVSPTGKHALGVSFSRLFSFRPGYGYAGIPDAYDSIDHPEEDGVFLVDMETGEAEIILTLDDIWRHLPESLRVQMVGDRLLINHITFNTDGTRFLFLPRNNPRQAGKRWATAIMTADLAGRSAYCLNDSGMASHYHWRDPASLVCYCRVNGRDGLYLLTDETEHVELVDSGFFRHDGHCCFSPDRNWLLYDSYPLDGYRYLYVYDLRNRRGVTLGAFYSDPVSTGDIRTDLHPRWSRSGREITFDSTHEGSRQVYRMNLEPVVG